jgi:hypothetical protein
MMAGEREPSGQPPRRLAMRREIFETRAHRERNPVAGALGRLRR